MLGFRLPRSGGTTFITAMQRGQTEARAAPIIICSTVIPTGYFPVRHTAEQGLNFLIKFAKVCAAITRKPKAPTGPAASLCNNAFLARPVSPKNKGSGYFYAIMSTIVLRR